MISMGDSAIGPRYDKEAIIDMIAYRRKSMHAPRTDDRDGFRFPCLQCAFNFSEVSRAIFFISNSTARGAGPRRNDDELSPRRDARSAPFSRLLVTTTRR